MLLRNPRFSPEALQGEGRGRGHSVEVMGLAVGGPLCVTSCGTAPGRDAGMKEAKGQASREEKRGGGWGESGAGLPRVPPGAGTARALPR